MVKVISNEEFVRMFGEEYMYESNEARLLDALQMYLQGERKAEDVAMDLWEINFDECFEGDVHYIPQAAIDDTNRFFEIFRHNGCEEIFTMK